MIDFSNELRPKIMVTEEEMNTMDSRLKGGLVLKVLGKRVPYTILKHRLDQLWSPNITYTPTDLPIMIIFLVKFATTEDREWVLLGGPWMVQGHYLTVREWTSDFDPWSTQVERTVVWVRIPSLPLQLHCGIMLRRIGAALGRPIRIDKNTGTVSRGIFTRLCSEVDLTKPLRPEIEFDGKLYQVEFEGLHLIYFGCGRYGHRKEGCRTVMEHKADAGGLGGEIQVVPSENDGVAAPEVNQQVVEESPTVKEGGLFDPWMMVRNCVNLEL
ncbi:uncharacterized protein LOC116189749 [Punica granatum]|uniref:DUF4283 domain-containing protein n=2 Tax=Punica granatum TaxID=22663 RepID=A0A2I0INQ0_PUNGR|nr:uncharacterized protein LOC116189749 [Punica granatum]PKI45343.1 hypothetical protein CRG98_034261 [Punica granatum]